MSVYETPHEKALDVDRYRLMCYINNSSLWPSACATILRSHIANAQLLFRTEDGRHLDLSPRFQRYLQTFWHPFIRNCVDEILTLGIVAVSFEVHREESGGSIVVAPYVIKGGLGHAYTITIAPDFTRIGRYKFRFYRLLDERGFSCLPRIDHNVRIFHGFGYDPKPNGRLTSIVSSIVWQEKYIARMYMYTLRTEQMRSEAAIYIESTNQIVPEDKDVDYFVNGDHTQRAEEMSYRMSQREMESIERARQLAAANAMKEARRACENPNELADGFDLFERVGTDHEQPIVPIPEGRRVTNVTAPSSGREWDSVNQNYQNLVCAAYGVPRSMILSDSKGGVRSGGREEMSMLRSQFQHTLSAWKHMMEQILEPCYNDLFGDAEADFMFADTVLNLTKKQRERTTTEETEKKHQRPNDEDDGVSELDKPLSQRGLKSDNNNSVVANANRAASDWLGRTVTHNHLLEYRRHLRQHVRQLASDPNVPPTTASIARYNPDRVVQALTKATFPALLKRLNSLPDDIETNDPEFVMYADQILSLIHDRAHRNRVKIMYVSVPNVHNDDLFFLYAFQVLDWPETSQAMRSANNLPISLNHQADPWPVEAKGEMLRTIQRQLLARVGETIGKRFGSDENDDDDDDNDDDVSNKQNKNSSPKKKSKKRKNADSDTDDEDTDTSDNESSNKRQSKTTQPDGKRRKKKW